jgi:hypothetical protein
MRKVKTSFSIVASSARELSGCDCSAENEMHRAEGEEEMSEPKKGLSSLGLDNAIRLRWALPDIKRLKLTPVNPNDVRILIDMGCVEMISDFVTALGLQQIDE